MRYLLFTFWEYIIKGMFSIVVIIVIAIASNLGKGFYHSKFKKNKDGKSNKKKDKQAA